MNEVTQAARAALSEYDFIVLIDRSGSMDRPVKAASSRTRWQSVQETAQQFADTISQIDTDGIGVITFGAGPVQEFEGVTGDKVADVFENARPGGGTPLDAALKAAFKMAEKNGKKDFIVVFTDGEPDDPLAVANVLKAKANSQQADDECTVLFVQVGDDAAATRYLAQLDDGLKGAKFDIVDAKTQEQAELYTSIEQLLMDAITD